LIVVNVRVVMANLKKNRKRSLAFLLRVNASMNLLRDFVEAELKISCGHLSHEGLFDAACEAAGAQRPERLRGEGWPRYAVRLVRMLALGEPRLLKSFRADEELRCAHWREI
jgi:hypothetical protein